MPRNGKRYSVPHHASNVSNNAAIATTTASTVSHFTQSDDEGNVIIEVGIQPHAVGCGVVPEIPEVEPDTNILIITHPLQSQSDELTTSIALDGVAIGVTLDEKPVSSAPEITTAIEIESNLTTTVTATAAAAAAAAATATATATATPTPTPTATATATASSGFFRSLCRCFKGVCRLMCCCCCCRRRRGSVQIPNEA